VVWGTDIPKDREEINRREVSECDGSVFDVDVIGVPSMFRLKRSDVTFVRMLSIFELRCIGQVYSFVSRNRGKR
jgi:hypothetical protein